MSRIAVVGPGSVGVFFAAHLAANGHDVLSCARRPFAQYIIESDSHALQQKARVVTAVSDIPQTHLGDCEWVFFCVKAHQTESAGSWLEQLCSAQTKVVVVQNGIEHDRCQPWVNGAKVIPSAVYCGAQLVSPGFVRHTIGSHLEVADDEFGAALALLFDGSRAEIHRVESLALAQWRKLGLNVVANGLTALTNRSMSVIAHPSILPVAQHLLRECWQVAQADGVSIDPGAADETIDNLVSRNSDGVTSMLADARANRPTEHDAIYGAVIRRATELDVPIPTIRLIHALLDARAS